MVDVADEAQGDVIVLGVDPARAGQPAAVARQLLADRWRDLEAGT
jgi:hypothetical protein